MPKQPTKQFTIPEGDKIEDFARKHHVSMNWVRTLVRRYLEGRPGIPATLIGPPLSPVPYYLIPPGTKMPKLHRGRPLGKAVQSTGKVIKSTLKTTINGKHARYYPPGKEPNLSKTKRRAKAA